MSLQGIELARAYVRVDADVKPYTSKIVGAQATTASAARGMDASMARASRSSSAAAARSAASWRSTAATAGASMTTVGRKATSMGGTLTKGATLPIAAGFALAAKVAIDFEKQLDKLGSVSGANAKQMSALRKQALQLGADTIYSAGEVAAAQTELAKGGLKVKTILGGALPAALALAAAGELDLADAGATVANSLNQFGIKGKGAMRVADMLATAANTTTADVKDFSLALTQGGSVAKMAGLGMNQTMVALEALAKSSVKGSDAGTSLKTSMIQLLSPTEKQQELAEKLNLTFVNSKGEMKDMASISAMLRRETGDMTKAQRAAAFSTLAGTDGIRTLNALYDAGPRKLKAYAKANLEQGTAAEVAKKQMDNTAGAIEEMKGALETTAIVIGTEVIPVVTDVAQFVGTAATAFGELPAPVRKTAVAAGLVVAAAGPLMSIFGYLSRGAGAIATGMSRIGGATQKTATAMQAATTASQSSLLIANSSGVITGEHYVDGIGQGVEKGTRGAGWRSRVRTGLNRAMPVAKGVGISIGIAGLMTGVAEGASTAARGGNFGQKMDDAMSSFASTISFGALEGIIQPKWTEIWDKSAATAIDAMAKWPSQIDSNLARYWSQVPATASAEAMAETLLPNDTQWKNLTDEQKVKFTTVYNSVKAAMAAKARTGITIPIDVEAPAPAAITQSWSTAFANLRRGVGTSMGDIDKLLNTSLNGIRQSMRTKPNQARVAMSRAFQMAAHNVLQSMKRGEIGTDQALARIRKLMRNAQLVRGQDPFGIAQGFTSSWKKAGGISRRSQKDVINDLKMMPPAARQQAWNTMMQIGSGLARKKQIPIAQLRDLRSKVAVDLGLMRTRAVKSTGAMADGVNRNMGDLSSGIGSTYITIRDNTNNALGSFGVKPISYEVSGIQGKAQGGYVDAPSMHDSALAMIGRDEAVLTRHQQGPVQEALAFHAAVGGGRYGSLGQVFSGERKPNAYARGKKPTMSGPPPFANYGQGNIDKVWAASRKYIDEKRPKQSVGGITYVGPPANMRRLGDASWVDTHTLAVGAYMANKFGVSITDGWRPADAGYGAANSSHKRGTPSNPGALDFAPPSTAFQRFAGQHIAGLTENLMNDAYSTGPHNHLAFFKRGGYGGGGMWKGATIDKVYPKTDGYSGARLPAYQIMALAQSYGMPGRTMFQITQGESMGRPGVDISDPPGRSRGLYAVNDHYNPQYSATMLRNPIYATWAASELAGAAGGPNSNIWHGDKHVTGWDLDYDADALKLRRIAWRLGGDKSGHRAYKAARRGSRANQRLWDRIKEKGTTANGRKRAKRAGELSRRAAKAALRGDDGRARRLNERAARLRKAGYVSIANRQEQKRQAQGGGSKPGSKPTKPTKPGGVPGLVPIPGIDRDSDHFDLLWAGIPADVRPDLATYQRTFVGVQALAKEIAIKANAVKKAEWGRKQYAKSRAARRKGLGETFDTKGKKLTARFDRRADRIRSRDEAGKVFIANGGVRPDGKPGGYWKRVPKLSDRQIAAKLRELDKKEERMRKRLDQREKRRKAKFDEKTKLGTKTRDDRIDVLSEGRQAIEDLKSQMQDIRDESYGIVKTGLIMQQTQLPLTAQFLGRYKMGGTLPYDGMYYGHRGEEVLSRPEAEAYRGGGGPAQVDVAVYVNGTIIADGSGKDPLEVYVDGNKKEIATKVSKEIGKRASRGRMTAGGNRRVGGR